MLDTEKNKQTKKNRHAQVPAGIKQATREVLCNLQGLQRVYFFAFCIFTTANRIHIASQEVGRYFLTVPGFPGTSRHSADEFPLVRCCPCLSLRLALYSGYTGRTGGLSTAAKEVDHFCFSPSTEEMKGELPSY